jgi:hypothetical protein
MPKARQTCTRCSMRRQKCDRKDPCTRCVQSNEASSCSRKWPHDYDPKIHRSYPKGRALQPRLHNYASESIATGVVPEGGTRNVSLSQNAATTQRIPSSKSTSHGQHSNTQNLLGRTYANNKRKEAPSEPRLSRAGNDPSPLEFLLTNKILGPSDFDSNIIQLSKNANVDTGNSGSNAGRSLADISPGSVEKHYLQTLLPTDRQILQLVEYHEAYLLWFHRCVHGPTFRFELLKALENSDGLQLKCLDLRWCAILFAIMSASLTCTCDSIANSWGFSKTDKINSCKQWYRAAISCLYLGDYTRSLHVYSIQAVQVLSLSAHTLGFSNEHFIYLGAALRIAQSLGLQRLVYDAEVDDIAVNEAMISQDRKESLIKKEVGRRIWFQLCTQDWFSTPACEMYSINKLHFTTIRPRRFDDETMGPPGDNVPVEIDIGNYWYDIASLMADFHDSFVCSVTLAAKYEQVLKYDSRLRALGTEAMPHPFSSVQGPELLRPQWVTWARGATRILHTHKIIMVHRNFLGKSFADPRFAYTRWASIAASKTILREVEIASADVAMPMLWPYQV